VRTNPIPGWTSRSTRGSALAPLWGLSFNRLCGTARLRLLDLDLRLLRDYRAAAGIARRLSDAVGDILKAVSRRTKTAVPHASPTGDGLSERTELALLRELSTFSSRQRDARDADKALRSALRLAMDFFGAAEGCLAALPAHGDAVEILFDVSQKKGWPEDLVTRFIRGEKITMPPDLMIARIRRRGRKWGALVLRHAGADFQWEQRRALSRVTALTGEIVERIDLERMREVRARIDRKIMEKIRPQDLFYQILDGLRSLTGYDHSASVLICNDDADTLEIVAEQIAWRKGKSRSVGRTLPMSPAVRELLGQEVVYGFQRFDRGWVELDDRPADELAALVDDDAADDEPREGAILCAPLVSRDGPLGLLRVASRDRGALGRYEAELVSRFLPQASVAVQNNQRTQSLERQMVEAERKSAMADLARGVSHDVNNAIGAVLPLVQEIRSEADAGAVDAQVVADDMREIERSMQVCRRIFGGMLRFARGAARSVGPVHLHEVVQCVLDILRESLERREITITADVPSNLPPVRGLQSEVVQLMLNLVTNAGDATSPGGRISLRAVHEAPAIHLTIEDTGCGIPADMLARIREPFFTTKRSGSGLGLAICRSIVSQMHGRFEIESVVDEGTRVTVTLAAMEDAAS
jgi:signal transduction histidine kinase